MAKACHLIIEYDVSNPPNPPDLQKLLEKGTLEQKIDAMKTLILMILQDENFPRMIMTVVQHIMRVESHEVKKLLLLYWEIIEKTKPDGTIKDEMVMLCNALRKDLLSPNEYVRARTLRLIARMRYREMLDSLLTPILECLEHRHPYVRRNAVMCVYSIFLSFGEEPLPDAVSRIDAMLSNETDLSTRRNSLLFLFEASPATAIKYLNSVLLDENDEHSNLFGSSADILQLIVLEELKKVCKNNPMEKGKYIKAIYSVAASSKSQSVLFECASTIVELTSAHPAIKTAVATYIKLLNDPSADNNIKLIVLDKLKELNSKFSKLLQEQAVDILRVISTPSDDIRKLSLNLVLDLLSLRNIEDVIRILKKELQNVQSQKELSNYQEMLVKAIHKCAVTFPEITGQQGLVDVLLDCCLVDDASSIEVARFLQQLVYTYPYLRDPVLVKLYSLFGMIPNPTVQRIAMWILAAYSDDTVKSVKTILNAVGEAPFINKRERKQQVEATTEGEVHRTVILPDGTYGTQVLSKAELASKPSHISGLRKNLTETEEVDYYLITGVCLSLIKLLLRTTADEPDLIKDALAVMCALVQVRSYPRKFIKDIKEEVIYTEHPYTIDPDNYERILQCISALLGQLDTDIFKDSLKSYKGNLKLESDGYKTHEATDDHLISQPDDLIIIKQLKGREGLGELDFGDDESFKSNMMSQDEENFSVKLGKIQQLTGVGDPIYCECVVNVHHYDISLDFLVLNRSEQTAQNLTLELASEGDLKLVDRPQTVNLAAGKSERLKASVKVSSTEAGLIFGNLTYEYMREGTKIIPLNDLHIDSLQYLHPATCTDVEFRTMWSKFKGEDQVSITAKGNLRKFVLELAKRSNVKCLTPDAILNCSKDFLVANFYARTHFGEDALLNVSIESTSTGISGCLRVRGETEGMVKCLTGKMKDLISTLSKVIIE